MRDERGLDSSTIAACLTMHYGVAVAAVGYLPIGNDFQAAVYRVVATDGTAYFLKVRFGPVYEPGLAVARALHERGVAAVLAPLRTRSSALWCPLDAVAGATVVLYPFVQGDNAKVAGMSDAQWREFGAALRGVHASGLDATFRDRLPVETFRLPAAAAVRKVLAGLDASAAAYAGPAATGFAAFWRGNAGRIRGLLARAETIGSRLRAKAFDHVLCHGDIHGANVLTGADGRIWLVDWDGPLIAPRERDLLFVVGSRIGRPVTPDEEDRFFAGYGMAEIDPEALAYYRYERRIEDLAETARRVFHDPHLSEPARAAQAAGTVALFAPGGDFDVAEIVPRRRWPRSTA